MDELKILLVIYCAILELVVLLIIFNLWHTKNIQKVDVKKPWGIFKQQIFRWIFETSQVKLQNTIYK